MGILLVAFVFFANCIFANFLLPIESATRHF